MPLNEGSSSNNWIILTVVPFGESGFLPPPVLFRETAHLLCSFLAELTIPLHFSFTSATLLLHTPRAFTLEVISSQTHDLFLFDNIEENLLLIVLRFSSASLKITAHSAGIKLGFLGRLTGEGSIFSAMLLSRNLSSRKTRFITMATVWIAIYPSDSYTQGYPRFVQQLFIHWITIQWITVLSTG